VNPSPPCLLNHVLKCHICTFFEHLQGDSVPGVCTVNKLQICKELLIVVIVMLILALISLQLFSTDRLKDYFGEVPVGMTNSFIF